MQVTPEELLKARLEIAEEKRVQAEAEGNADRARRYAKLQTKLHREIAELAVEETH